MTAIPYSSFRPTVTAYGRVLFAPSRMLRGYAILVASVAAAAFLASDGRIEIAAAFAVPLEAVPMLGVALMFLSATAWASADRVTPRLALLTVAYLQAFALILLVFRPTGYGGVGTAYVVIALISVLFSFLGWDVGAAAGPYGIGGTGATAPLTRETRIRESARREERTRLARDLHDAVKQQLFVVRTAAATAQERLRSDAAGASEALEQVRGAARDAITELEALLDGLQTTPATSAGLTDAIRQQCEALEHRTGARVTFEHDPPPSLARLNAGAEEAIFRIAQEALSNVSRHARARNVTIRLAWADDALTLTIADDGSGFAAETLSAGVGMTSMRSRAAEAGGTFDISSRPGAGTTLTVQLPRLSPSTLKPLRRNVIASGIACTYMLVMFGVAQFALAPQHQWMWVLWLPLAMQAAGAIGAYRRRLKEIRRS